MDSRPVDRRKGWTPQPRPEWVQRINEEGGYMDATGVVPLDADSLIAAAMRNTGLTDFGSDDWRDPFKVLVKAFDEESELHLIGRLWARSEVLMFLEGRLRIEDTYKRHPEIEDEEIVKPLLLMGQGRSGTTGMHHLLSADPELRAPATWGIMLPYPPPEKATFHSDPRIRKAHDRITIWNRVTPEIVSMHDFAGELATETIQIHALAFQSPGWFNLLGQVPSYNEYMAKIGTRGAYEYERRVCKYLQWKNPGLRWVHKTIYPDVMLDVLKYFPDTQFVWVHRDPIKSLASLVNVTGTVFWAHSDRTYTDRITEGQAGDLESLASAQALAGRMNTIIDWLDKGLVPKQQICNVLYKDYVADPLDTVKWIYERFSIDVPETSFVALQAHIDKVARQRATKLPFTYEIGTPEQVAKEREIYRRYQTYFSIPSEA